SQGTFASRIRTSIRPMTVMAFCAIRTAPSPRLTFRAQVTPTCRASMTRMSRPVFGSSPTARLSTPLCGHETAGLPPSTPRALERGTGANQQGTPPSNINASGAIAGYFLDNESISHGFVRGCDGTLTQFDAPG